MILHLLSNRWNSAITEYALQSIQALDTEYQQYFFCLANKPAHSRAIELEIPTIPLKNFIPTINSILTLKNFQKHDPVIITYGGPEEILAQLCGFRKIFRFIGERKKYNRFSRLSHYQTTALICPSDIIKNEIISNKVHHNVHTIPLGLPIPCNHENNRYQNPTILIFGRFDPIKGHREFIKILKIAYSIGLNPDCKLRIIGNSANLAPQNIMDYARSEGLEDSIEIIEKRVSNKDQIMSETTLGIVCSLGSEIICRVAQEFLLNGCPVFLSNAGSLPEVLIEENFGSCFDFNNPTEAARLLIALVTNSMQEDVNIRKKRRQASENYFALNAFKNNWISTLKIYDPATTGSNVEDLVDLPSSL